MSELAKDRAGRRRRAPRGSSTEPTDGAQKGKKKAPDTSSESVINPNAALAELFPDWQKDDLDVVLLDAGNDLNEAIRRITEGLAAKSVQVKSRREQKEQRAKSKDVKPETRAKETKTVKTAAKPPVKQPIKATTKPKAKAAPPVSTASTASTTAGTPVNASVNGKMSWAQALAGPEPQAINTATANALVAPKTSIEQSVSPELSTSTSAASSNTSAGQEEETKPKTPAPAADEVNLRPNGKQSWAQALSLPPKAKEVPETVVEADEAKSAEVPEVLDTGAPEQSEASAPVEEKRRSRRKKKSASPSAEVTKQLEKLDLPTGPAADKKRERRRKRGDKEKELVEGRLEQEVQEVQEVQESKESQDKAQKDVNPSENSTASAVPPVPNASAPLGPGPAGPAGPTGPTGPAGPGAEDFRYGEAPPMMQFHPYMQYGMPHPMHQFMPSQYPAQGQQPFPYTPMPPMGMPMHSAQSAPAGNVPAGQPHQQFQGQQGQFPEYSYNGATPYGQYGFRGGYDYNYEQAPYMPMYYNPQFGAAPMPPPQMPPQNPESPASQSKGVYWQGQYQQPYYDSQRWNEFQQ